MFFSMSKIGSMPDLRFGWAFVKNKTVADRMKAFISASIQNLPGPAVLRTVKLLQVINNSKNDGKNEFFQYGYNKLSKRFDALNEIVDGSNNKLTIVSDFGVFFLVKCNEFSEEETAENSCQALFDNVGIETRLGSRYGYEASQGIIMMYRRHRC